MDNKPVGNPKSRISHVGYTKGDWLIRCDNKLHGEYTIYVGDDPEAPDATICSVSGALGVYEEGCIESEENARLIASGPMMFEALAEIAILTDNPAARIAQNALSSLLAIEIPDEQDDPCNKPVLPYVRA